MGAINKMGLELEGAWYGTHRVPPFKDAKIKHDGSVIFSPPIDGQYLHYGELVSEPLDPEALAKWGQDHCPTAANDSAGTHLHFSVKERAMYGALLTPAFSKVILKAYEKYNDLFIASDPETHQRFARRLAGGNRFCKKGYKGLSQVSMAARGSDRYQQLNYCFKLHGTVEIRVLPCTTNAEFIRGVVLLTRDVIEDFLAREYVSTKKVRFRRG